MGFPSTSNFVKNSPLRVVFSTLFSVFGYPDETRMLLIPGTGNGERGTGNGERGTGNGGTGNGERGTGNGERDGSGNECTAVTRLRIKNDGGNDVYKH